jgi:hypothetical protein
MNVALKNIKVNKEMSDETESFSATIYISGKREGTVFNRGCGGPHEYEFYNNEVHKAFLKFCSGQPHEYEFDVDDQYIDTLLDKWEITKQLKKWCKSNVVFRLKDTKKDSWVLVKLGKHKYSDQIKEACEKKYGDQLVEIANERF